MTVYMFPGQGAQVKGMGREEFSQYPQYLEKADNILGYSVSELCLDDPNQQLAQTQYTQVALFTVEALSYLQHAQQNAKPDYCIGHSLGEYSALFAANVFDFETGIRLVKKRGELMAQAQGGGMCAVINLSHERISEILELNNLDGIDCANFNTPKQIVLSGPAQDIERAQQLLSPEATMCVPLRVSGAFHSRYMREAADEFDNFIQEFEFNAPEISVIANVDAKPYTQDKIKENLIKQIVSPVRWNDSIVYLREQDETQFEEIGPGNILSRMLAQI